MTRWRTTTLWMGATAAYVGVEGAYLMLVWTALSVGGGGIDVGMLIAFYITPSLAGGPIAGAMLSRFPARWSAISLIVPMAGLITAVGILSSADRLPFWLLLVLAGAVGFLEPTKTITLRVVMPRFLVGDALERGNRIVGGASHVGVLIGPLAAGGLLTAFGEAAAGVVLAIGPMMLAAAVLWLPAGVDRPTPVHRLPPCPPTSPYRSLLADRRVVLLVAISALFSLAYAPLETALPIIVAATADASLLGLLWTLHGGGAVVGLLIAPRIGIRPAALTLPTIVAWWGAWMLPFALAPSPPLFAACFFIASLAWGPYQAYEATILQRRTDQLVHGHLFGARTTVVEVAFVAGVVVGGLIVDAWGAVAAVLISSVACLLIGAAGVAVMRRPARSSTVC